MKESRRPRSAVTPLEPGDDSATGNVLTNDTDVDEDDTKTVVGVQPCGSHGVDVRGLVGNVNAGTYGTL